MTGELEALLEALCDRLPSAIGAVLCDFEGESVVAALGAAPVPPDAEARAREHVPRALALTMPVKEFLIRLAGAEPCALLGCSVRPRRCTAVVRSSGSSFATRRSTCSCAACPATSTSSSCCVDLR